mmetsp:Transcript_6100/g.9813  ORF Transcript_6100/g.9813 Transcript_6100/m.9813 type:complete len:110 (+) Transcript_6100:190-519(+)
MLFLLQRSIHLLLTPFNSHLWVLIAFLRWKNNSIRQMNCDRFCNQKSSVECDAMRCDAMQVDSDRRGFSAQQSHAPAVISLRAGDGYRPVLRLLVVSVLFARSSSTMEM